MRVLVLGTVCVLAACAEHSDDPGREIYLSYCSICHGVDARGSGRLASELPVPPADLTQLSAENDGIFPSARVMEKIYGYPGRYQSDVMPEFGSVLEGQEALWTDENGTEIATPQALLDLRDYLASLQIQ